MAKVKISKKQHMADPRLMVRYGGIVPVVLLLVCQMHSMMSTIRHNRARGRHGVVRKTDIVRSMVEEDLPKQQIMRRLGMEDEEVERLIDRAGMPDQVGRERQEFAKAWVPQR